MHQNRAALFLLLSCLSLWLRGQEFVFKHYGLQDGLANPTIHSIFQDRNGFLWFGTESGLCRYDGNSFKTFTVKDGLPGNEVYGMFEDSKERLWLQQYKNTIGYIHNGRVYNQENDSLLKKIKLTSRVHGIAEDKNGNIALCDNESVLMIKNGSQSILRVTSPGKNALYFVGMFLDNSKNIVVCTQNDLYTINDLHLQYLKQVTVPKDRLGPTDVLLHANYLAHRLYGKTTIFLKDTVIARPAQPNIFTIKFSAISDSVLSINTTDGAFLFNLHSRSFLKILPGLRVTNVYEDREQNLWIGTLGRGIYKRSSRYILNNKINAGENDIFYLSKDGNNIIVGTNDGNVYGYHANKFEDKSASIRGRLPLRKVFYYENEGKNTSLLVHSMGLARYDGKEVIDSRSLRMLKQGTPSDPNHLLVAVDSGIYRVTKKDFTIVDTIWERKSLSFLNCDDTIWVGTLGGLFVLKKANNKYVIVDSLILSSIVAFIKKSADGILWVATYEDGLYCVRNSKILRHFTDTSGLPSNNGRSLFIRNNDVWEGTDMGLVKFTSNGTSFPTIKYFLSDGLPSSIVNSVFVDDSIVYLGTPEGLSYFDENKNETTSMCNLVLTGVTIGGVPVDLADKYELTRNRQVNITFSGISFRSEKEMFYRYRISGVDDQWRITKVNSLEFASLPYGDYVLEIIATNKFGKQSSPLLIKFFVKKPFYYTAWFLIIAAIILISAILFVHSLHMRNVRQKQVEKLKQEMKLMELEQMALRAQMNPHFIFNCINVMQQLVADNDQQDAEKFILSFSNLVRQTLDNATQLYIPLVDEIKFLTNYFELERIRLEDRFSYSINTENVVDMEKTSVPNMVIQPFVENAVKHGIRYKKNGAGSILVDFYQNGDLLRCTVADNGVGREKAQQIQMDLGNAHSSKGMSITAKRIASLNALSGGKITVVIEDLKDKDNQATGTKVIIEFHQRYNSYDQDSNN